MSRDIKRIFHSFDSILKENKSFLKEVSASSDSLFGGINVKIPTDGAHAGQSGWQSNNAWDIQAPIGSPVYAIADGVAETFQDYGNEITKTQGKKLYGQSFTVKSDNNLPKVYYTHLQDSPVRQGSRIQCGQFIGYVMDMPDSEYDHVHIGVESGHDIKEFLNSDGKLVCGGGSISGDVSKFNSKSLTGSTSSEEIGNVIMGNFIDKLSSIVKEGKVYSIFGRDPKDSGGSFVLSKDKNSTIYSPVSGIINNVKINLNCKNQLTLYHDVNGKEYHLEFCGISKPYVKNGQTVSQGTVLGKTNDNVVITLFDDRWKRVDLKSASKVEIIKDKNKKSVDPKTVDKPRKSPTSYKLKSGFSDPAVDFFGSILTYPFRAFEKKNDDESKNSKFASPTSKNQPEPGFLLNMFKKKKVTEDIERIKNLLK